MPEHHITRRHLVPNNRRLDMASLEQRIDEMLAERPSVPAATQALPSRLPLEIKTSRLRLLLRRLRSSRLVVHWLPRYPRLYRLARALYQGVKSAVGRS